MKKLKNLGAKMIDPDPDRIIDIVRNIEIIFKDMDAVYTETFPAALYIAVVSANEMGMDRKAFIKHCEKLFDSDKKEHLRALQ
jgi:hypothetical protein